MGASSFTGPVRVGTESDSAGYLAVSRTANAGNYTATVTNASQAADRTYTIPDAGANASFVMTAGSQTIGGTKTFSSAITASGGLAGALTGNVSLPIGTVAGAGTDNTNAAALAAGVNVVTGGNGTVGVILPTATATNSTMVIVKNNAAAILKVYPSASAAINDLTATTGAISMAANTSALFFSTSATQYYTLPLLPS